MGRSVPVEPRWSADASPAEELLWRWAVEQLPERVLVVPQVSIRRSTRGRPEEAELDLVLIDPEAGVTVVEVKGGSMSYSASKSMWHQNGRESRDPVQQVQRARSILRSALEAGPFDERGLALRWAVAFPQCRMDAPGGTVLDDENLWDDRACTDLATLYAEVVGELGQDEEPLGEHRASYISRFLRGKDQDGRPSILAAVDHHEHLVEVRTESHRNVLAHFSANPNVLVRGAAGTGKTVLAIQLAAQRAAFGDRVLLTCWNVVLGSWLRHSLKAQLEAMGSPMASEVTDDPTGRIVACDLGELGERAVGDLPDMELAELYREWLPTRLADLGGGATDGGFDLVVLDEAQDLTLEWELAVASLVGKDGRWYAFSDRRQDLFATGSSLPDFLEVEHELKENFRNSPAIAEFAGRFGHIEVDCATDAGTPVEFVAVPSDRVLDKTKELARKLVKKEGFEPADVAALFLFHNPSQHHADDLARAALAGEMICTNAASFKGMERPVVVLGLDLDPSKIERAGNVDAAIYTAATRARSHLVVVGNADACDAYGFDWLAEQLGTPG